MMAASCIADAKYGRVSAIQCRVESKMHSKQVVRSIIDQVSADRIRYHIKVLEGVRHPITGMAALTRAARYIEVSLESLGYSVNRQSFMDKNHAEYLARLRNLSGQAMSAEFKAAFLLRAALAQTDAAPLA